MKSRSRAKRVLVTTACLAAFILSVLMGIGASSIPGRRLDATFHFILGAIWVLVWLWTSPERFPVTTKIRLAVAASIALTWGVLGILMIRNGETHFGWFSWTVASLLLIVFYIDHRRKRRKAAVVRRVGTQS